MTLQSLPDYCELCRREVSGFPVARFYDNRISMKKSINDNRKTRGRPATGTSPLVGVRMTPEFQKPIRDWANAQDDNPSMAEAVRRLIEIGLSAAPLPRGGDFSRGPTARDLAAAQIDRMGDADASADDQATRKRRLLKGPQEFRDSRIDVEARPRLRPKVK
jgi:hypothetical protein